MKTKIVGIPLNFGANRCGLEFGVDNFIDRYPKYRDKIEVLGVEREVEDFSRKNAKYLNTVAKTCEKLAVSINKIVKDGNFPITLGGDHAIAIGSIAGVSKEKEIGILWMDAHGDMNTPEISESGHIHGMPLAASIGYGHSKLVDCLYKGTKVKKENVILFGTRDIDEKEQELIDELGIKNYTWDMIAEMGFEKALGEVKEFFKDKNLHISFDLDGIDPAEITAVGTPVPGGLSREMGKTLVSEMIDTASVTSIDIVEYNPIYEKGAETSEYVDELLQLIEKKIN
ncbi:arginase [Psychrilyobacter sp. S5]|uniref:arginase n=1 Tax=Psychrilyobacter sp. S5 TaxID=2283384 RepID=UPI0021757A32|nr:arginase [Psychrilyobacter sp. S5]MCS5420384.1 arginase [Psychrilyobacter sp. S5]